jgi:hypothetical protein
MATMFSLEKCPCVRQEVMPPHTMSGLLAYSIRYRLGYKVLPLKNVLAYFGGASMTNSKRLSALTTGRENENKTFLYFV